jgi:hypothetical protein
VLQSGTSQKSAPPSTGPSPGPPPPDYRRVVQISAVDAEILELLRAQSHCATSSHKELSQANNDIVVLHDTMKTILEQASMTQQKVDAICTDIRAMDHAKRHLTQSISILENFGTLTDALADLKESGSNRCTPLSHCKERTAQPCKSTHVYTHCKSRTASAAAASMLVTMAGLGHCLPALCSLVFHSARCKAIFLADIPSPAPNGQMLHARLCSQHEYIEPQ